MLAAVNPLTDRLVGDSILMGTLLLVLGALVVVAESIIRIKTSLSSAAVAKAAEEKASGTDLQEQGAVSKVLDSVAGLAGALKDLDVGTRVMLLGIALYGIAAVAAGADAVAGAVAS